MFELSQIWLMRATSGWLLCSFHMIPEIFECFLTKGVLGSTCSFPSPTPGTSDFSKELCFPFSGKWYLETKIMVLDVLIVTVMLLLLGLLSRHSQGLDVCMYIHRHTHLLFFVFIDIGNHSGFFPFHVYNSLTENWLPLSLIYIIRLIPCCKTNLLSPSIPLLHGHLLCLP